MATVIQYDKVRKVYNSSLDEVVALQEVSFSVAEGEVVTVVGRSGCGEDHLIGRNTGAAYFLHRRQKVEALEGLLEKEKRLGVPRTEIGFVDAFARETILIELEVTTKMNE
ncbi:MAG: hypothetical protein HYV04_15560 [Deltaproteobacteria bacterium]|nr:hypothetical protein [Deltaproteobacteria bacterium]